MESPSAELLLLLMAVGGLAGLVDTLAGGGGLITLPALLWAGLPPVQALATNKLQGSFGTLSASFWLWRGGLLDPWTLAPAMACGFIGAAAGALLAQSLRPDLLEHLIPFLLIGFALYVLFSPRMGDQASRARLGPLPFALLVGTSVGGYDGFFGPGTGSLCVLALVALRGEPLGRATAHAKALNFSSNLAALLAFMLGGQVLWSLGLAMAVGQFLGAWGGSRLVLRHGARLIRPLLALMSLALSVKLTLNGS